MSKYKFTRSSKGSAAISINSIETNQLFVDATDADPVFRVRQNNVGQSIMTVSTNPGTVSIIGDLDIQGNMTQTSSASYSTTDTLIELGNGNADDGKDTRDIGFYAPYANSGIKYTGIFRDADDSGAYIFFNEAASEPNTVVGSYTLANVKAGNITGTLVTSSQPNITSIGTCTTLSATGALSSGMTSGAGSGTLNLLSNPVTTGQINFTDDVGTAGSIVYNHFINTMTLKSNNTTGLIINSSGNTAMNAVECSSMYVSGTSFVFGQAGAGSPVIDIYSSAGGSGSINFSDLSDDRGRIVYEHTFDTLNFYTSGVEIVEFGYISGTSVPAIGINCSPRKSLHLTFNGSSAMSGANFGIGITGNATGSGIPGAIYFEDLANNKVFSLEQSNDTLSFNGCDQVGSTKTTSGILTMNHTGAVTAGVSFSSPSITSTGNMTLGNTDSFYSLTIKTGTGSSGSVYFNDGSNSGKINYNHSTNAMSFQTNATDALSIDSSQNVNVTVGALTIGDTADSTNNLTIYNSTTGTGNINFNDGSSSGKIEYSHTNNFMKLYANGVVKLDLRSTSVALGTTSDASNDLNIYSAAGATQAITFNFSGVGEKGSVEFDNSSNSMLLKTNGSTAVTIDSSQVLNYGSAVSTGTTTLNVLAGTNSIAGNSVQMLRFNTTPSNNVPQFLRFRGGGSGTITNGGILIGSYSTDSFFITGLGTALKIKYNSALDLTADPYNDYSDIFNLSSTGDLAIGNTSQSSTTATVLSTAAGSGALYFNDGSNSGQIVYNHSTNGMTIATAATTAVTIDSSQNTTFAGTIAASNFTSGSGSHTTSNLSNLSSISSATYKYQRCGSIVQVQSYLVCVANATASSFGFRMDVPATTGATLNAMVMATCVSSATTNFGLTTFPLSITADTLDLTIYMTGNFSSGQTLYVNLQISYNI